MYNAALFFLNIGIRVRRIFSIMTPFNTPSAITLSRGRLKCDGTRAEIRFLDFCLTVHHQLGKVIYMNQLDATMFY